MGYIWDDKKEDDDKYKAHLEKKITGATETLSNTNKGLLSDISKLKKSVKEKEGVDVEEFNTLKTENEVLKKKSQEGESEAEKQLRLAREQHVKDIKDLKDEVKGMKDNDKKNLIKSDVLDAILEIKVKTSMRKAAKKILTSDVTIEDGKPMVGDKTVMEYAQEWAKSEEGKNFVLAKKNKGGNSKGGDDEDDENEQEKFFDKESSSYNVTKQVQLKKTNLDLFNQLKEKYKK